MTGYTKTKTFLTNTTILAGDFNTEFNNLTVAFDATNGHSHNGDASLGAYVPLISSTDGFTKITTTEATDQLNFYTKVSGAAALQLSFKDGVIEPNADSDVDIGTTAKRFKDLYVDSAAVTGTVTAAGLSLGDGEYARFGNAGDLQMFHSGTHSYIQDQGTGILSIQSNGDSITFHDSANTRDMAKFSVDGAASLNWAGGTGSGTKLATTATGVDVTGTLTATNATINGTASFEDQITITANTSTAAAQPTLTLRSNEAASIDNQLAEITFQGHNDQQVDQTYVYMRAESPVITDNQEEGKLKFFVRKTGNAYANSLSVDSSGIDVTGTVNASDGLTADYLDLTGGKSTTTTGAICADKIRFSAETSDEAAIYASVDGLNTSLFIQSADDVDDKVRVVAGDTESLTVANTGINVTGAITVSGTVDGRDIATDGTKLDAIEAGADVTDTANVVEALTAGDNITIAGNGTITATDTDTTYSVQDGELSENNFTNDDHTKLNNIEASADITDTANVVEALTAGDNITIAGNGTITATDTNTEYTGGTGLTLSAGNEFSVDAAQTSITSVGALSGGSIASGFGAIDNGASAITTTGTVTTGSLVLNSSTSLTSIDTDISTVSAADDTLATSKAIKTYVDAVTAAASAGDIKSVVAGDGLTGGATSGDATVTVVGGVGIVANADEVVLDLNELTTSTADADGDFFAVVDTGGAQKKLTKANIALSGMNNDSGWTANAGTVTSVGAGTGLATTGGTTPSLSVNAAQSGITSLGTLSALNVTGDLTLEALYPTGTGNLFLGTISGGSAVAASSQYNTGVGNAALGAVTTATFNTAVGAAALQSLTTGTNNVAFGLNSSKSMVNASSNSSYGVSALYSLLGGSSNTALGTYAGYSLTTASSNVLVGVSAGYNLTTGGNNAVLGSNAARKAETVTNSVVIGQDAGYYLGSQGGIIAIGHDAMKGSATAGAFTGGEACIAIGENALESITTAVNCTAIGDQAGMEITTGTSNTLVGQLAGTDITTGARNLAIGDNAGRSITTADNTIAIGSYAGRYLGTSSLAIGTDAGRYQQGTNNIFIGDEAGEGDAALGALFGNKNTAIGNQSIKALTTGNYNVAVGWESLKAGTTCNYNTAIGSYSLNDLTIGNYNTAIGFEAAEFAAGDTFWTVSVGTQAGGHTGSLSVNVGHVAGYNQNGGANTFIGHSAGYGSVTYRNSQGAPATENTGIGYASLNNLAGGAFNTAIGRASGYLLTTGNDNTLLGRSAGYDLTTGSDNVLIGSLTGQNITTGSNNIVIGAGSGSGLSSANNVTIIGSFAGASPDMDSTSYAGAVVISSNDPSYPDPLLFMEKNGDVSIPATNGLWNGANGGFKFENVADTKILKWARGSTSNSNAYAQLFYGKTGSIIGSINSTSTSISISYTSDYRLKENVSPLTGSIDRIKALKPCTFNFLSEPTRQEEGFIAHEVQEVVPQAVVGVKDAVDENGDAELQGVDPSRIVVILTGALQEAIEKIEQLEERISALEA